jgi:hypothetical protein
VRLSDGHEASFEPRPCLVEGRLRGLQEQDGPGT